MPVYVDGPASPMFAEVALTGTCAHKDLAADRRFSSAFRDAAHLAPSGACVCWGIPFDAAQPITPGMEGHVIDVRGMRGSWFVFLHTTDVPPQPRDPTGFTTPPVRGYGGLNEHVADYVLRYEDGTEARQEIRRRRHINPVARPWGENCFEAVPFRKPRLRRTLSEQPGPVNWGTSITRVAYPDLDPFMCWLWAWENPWPDKMPEAITIVPRTEGLAVFGLSVGGGPAHPLRWERRRKAILRLPKSETLDPNPDASGVLPQIQIDMGQVISAQPRPMYPNQDWAKTANNEPPAVSEREALIEYACHPDAMFHVLGRAIPAAKLETAGRSGPLTVVAPAYQRVRIRVVEKGSSTPIAVKLHIHGEAGEYLAPLDRQRIVNTMWNEDYSCDFAHQDRHFCTYITGETVVDLPIGNVYIEVSKGFEARPIRKIHTVTERTRTITLQLERVLPWRARGWVTADTHVHFLSPATAMLEGAGEGVNIVNLLASQWGELMTNVGDFDGKTTHGAREVGGDGEWLVRVGTENRQHVLGHISLLGYQGCPIVPICAGGPDESAIGDPVDVLLTEWARQCRKQGGLVVLPHFPNPRAEHAAAIVDGSVDAIEMTSWGNLYGGIDPYSLSDWYRYLNCGYLVPAVGGTDKMAASTPVGAVRTYAQLEPDLPFTYENWMEAVRAGRTFVTYGPLMEFAVEGKPAGSRIEMRRTGGTVDVAYTLASVTLPMTRAELIVNGEIRESQAIGAREAGGAFSLKVDRSAWIALLVRGRTPGGREIIGAHSSPVMIDIEGSAHEAKADALTILEQIEGALAYLDTIGTRAETATYKRMRMTLTRAHRDLHNRMHQMGVFHDHTQAHDHPEHR